MNLFTLNSKLTSIEAIAPKVYIIKFEKPKDFTWAPGQYIGITTHPTHRRSYSVFEEDEENLIFLIDSKPGGRASIYWDEAKVGDVKFILGPYGKFTYQDTHYKKVFISTGTGIAPFYPMVKALREAKPEVEIDFIFGCRYLEDEIAYEFFRKFISNKFKYIRSITKLSESQIADDNPELDTYTERITSFLPELNYDWKNTEFYICGNPDMVTDTMNILTGLGADKVYFEKY